MGLAGLGDLVLTCTDDQSRNRRVGLALGRGEKLDEAIATIGQAVEGVKSAPEVYRLAQEQGIEMPISEQVYRVLYEGMAPQQAVEALLGRGQKAENG
jgi:glycerol-3-phosphate dehydrogenase (NAD(P)+)